MRKKALRVSLEAVKSLSNASLRGVRGGGGIGAVTPNGNVPWPEPPPVVVPHP